MGTKRFEFDWRDHLKMHDIIKHKKNGKIRVVRGFHMSSVIRGRLVAVKVIKQRCFKTSMNSPYTYLDRCLLANYVKLEVRAKPNPEIDNDIRKIWGQYKYSCTELVGIP